MDPKSSPPPKPEVLKQSASSHEDKAAREAENHGQTPEGTSMLAATAKTVQSFKPLSNLCEAFCGLHLFPNDPKRQLTAYHYCIPLDRDRRQCLIFLSNTPVAKLVGVEYIISEKLFKELPDDEKKFWHSHAYEVKAGIMVQVSKAMVPEMVVKTTEEPVLKVIANTYGKTWLTWPMDEKGEFSSNVPMGVPQLLMSLTNDEQVNTELLMKRDQDMSISTALKRKERDEMDLKVNPVAKGADQWLEPGKVFQLFDKGIHGCACECKAQHKEE